MVPTPWFIPIMKYPPQQFRIEKVKPKVLVARLSFNYPTKWRDIVYSRYPIRIEVIREEEAIIISYAK